MRVELVSQLTAEHLDFDGEFISEDRTAWTKGPPCMLRVSRNGQYAAVTNTYGQRGVVLNLTTKQRTMRLLRDDYHEDVSAFPVAFYEVNRRVLAIYATNWNRLDAFDAQSGELLTQRGPTSYTDSDLRPAHYLDYFHAQLTVSPNGNFIADNGWHWSPVGAVITWNVPRWINENVWESEDGETRKSLCWRSYYWDGPLCWMDDRRLIVWGLGDDDENLIPGVSIFDVTTGRETGWFAGPKGALVYDDDLLFSFNGEAGMTVWDTTTRERVGIDQGFCPLGYHRRSKYFMSVQPNGFVRISRLVGTRE